MVNPDFENGVIEGDEFMRDSGLDPTSMVNDPNNPKFKVIPTDRVIFGPYTSICQLTMTFRKKTGQPVTMGGTGFLVKESLILTAGHNILYPGNVGFADEVQVLVGGQIGTAKYGLESLLLTGSEALIVSDKWLANPQHGSQDDYGFIKLPKPYGQKMGTFNLEPLDVLLPKIKEILSVKVAGYALKDSRYPQIQIRRGDLYESEDRIIDVQGPMVRYGNDTVKGISGSPVYYPVNDFQATCIAIHTSSTGNSNQGVSINQEVIKDINRFNK